MGVERRRDWGAGFLRSAIGFPLASAPFDQFFGTCLLEHYIFFSLDGVTPPFTGGYHI